MKKLSIAFLTLLAGASPLVSQTVTISDYSGSFLLQICGPQPLTNSTVAVSYGGYGGYEEMGNTSNPNGNVGTNVYGSTSALGNPGYDVQLLAAPGTGDSLSTLSPCGPIISTWYATQGGNPTVGINGFYKTPTGSTTATVPGVTANGPVTVAVAAWANNGVFGAANTLAQAQSFGYAWGVSLTASIAQTGGGAVQLHIYQIRFQLLA
jgi:hypothetical protein